MKKQGVEWGFAKTVKEYNNLFVIGFDGSVLVYDEICHVVNQKAFKRQYESQFSEEDFKD